MDQATLARHLAAAAKQRAAAKAAKLRAAAKLRRAAAVPQVGSLGATVLDASTPIVDALNQPTDPVTTLANTLVPAAPSGTTNVANAWPTTPGTPGTPSPDGGVWGSDGFSHDPKTGKILYQPSKAAGGNALQHKQHVAYVAQNAAAGKTIGATANTSSANHRKLYLYGGGAIALLAAWKFGVLKKLKRLAKRR